MKSISKLSEVLSRPDEVYVRNGPEDWLAVLRSFGTRLPEDFIQFNKTYGDGYLISNQSPRTSSIEIFGSNGLKNSSFINRVPEILWNLRTMKQKQPNKVPVPLFWEPKGFLPWGIGTNEAIFGWISDGENPDKWPVAMLRPASRAFEAYDLSMAEFLLKVIQKEISSELLPKEMPGLKGVTYEAIKYGPPKIS